MGFIDFYSRSPCPECSADPIPVASLVARLRPRRWWRVGGCTGSVEGITPAVEVSFVIFPSDSAVDPSPVVDMPSISCLTCIFFLISSNSQISFCSVPSRVGIRRSIMPFCYAKFSCFGLLRTFAIWTSCWCCCWWQTTCGIESDFLNKFRGDALQLQHKSVFAKQLAYECDMILNFKNVASQRSRSRIFIEKWGNTHGRPRNWSYHDPNPNLGSKSWPIANRPLGMWE